MSDLIETIGSSIIQHGSDNDRIYLMKLHPDDSLHIIDHLDNLASSRGYAKIFAKVPRRNVDRFVAGGYELEASIPAFFPDGDAACFMGKYFTADRRAELKPQIVQEVLTASGIQGAIRQLVPLPPGCSARVAREEDTAEMAEVYREVFATYPFPIHDPEFLKAAMSGSTVFFGVWKEGRIIALSSAEMDLSSRSVEMTDFATLPDYRGHGLALNLLQQMEETVCSRGIRSLFTIARAYSFGMNITFARDGYSFGGTLTNNTNISGSLESMNVWYKTLS
ncbi:MAG: putative beta-lysine N-acetyltransferase, partial [Desulfuromonadaceae bacterium]|nr:putative beta-lysine N-acetyltransferase [Desulfuromonadaceae bacterium]